MSRLPVIVLAAASLYCGVIGRVESCALFAIAAGVWAIAYQRSDP